MQYILSSWDFNFQSSHLHTSSTSHFLLLVHSTSSIPSTMSSMAVQLVSLACVPTTSGRWWDGMTCSFPALGIPTCWWWNQSCFLPPRTATSQWYRKSNSTKWFLQAARPRLDPANEVHLFLVSHCPRPLFLCFDLSGAFSPSGLICRFLNYWRRPFNDIATRMYL